MTLDNPPEAYLQLYYAENDILDFDILCSHDKDVRKHEMLCLEQQYPTQVNCSPPLTWLSPYASKGTWPFVPVLERPQKAPRKDSILELMCRHGVGPQFGAVSPDILQNGSSRCMDVLIPEAVNVLQKAQDAGYDTDPGYQYISDSYYFELCANVMGALRLFTSASVVTTVSSSCTVSQQYTVVCGIILQFCGAPLVDNLLSMLKAPPSSPTFLALPASFSTTAVEANLKPYPHSSNSSNASIAFNASKAFNASNTPSSANRRRASTRTQKQNPRSPPVIAFFAVMLSSPDPAVLIPHLVCQLNSLNQRMFKPMQSASSPKPADQMLTSGYLHGLAYTLQLLLEAYTEAQSGKTGYWIGSEDELHWWQKRTIEQSAVDASDYDIVP